MATDEPAAEEPASIAVPDDVLTTEIVGAGSSYRRLGELFVSVLAGVPSVTLIASLIRAPGESGLDETRVIAGVVCAALAVALGVGLAVWVRTPVELSSAKLADFPMAQVVGTNQSSYGELLNRIDQLSDDATTANTAAARKDAERKLANVTTTLRRVHLIATARALHDRVLGWQTWALSGAALALAAAAVALLALAPLPKPATAGTSVVTVTLTEQGAQRLGCDARSFAALKVGGSDDAPQVVPLRTECSGGALLGLKLTEQDATASKVEAVEPASPTPTPAPTPSPG